jgi:hypothetical protein
MAERGEEELSRRDAWRLGVDEVSSHFEGWGQGICLEMR